MIKIYTDGSCQNNPGKGGWAAIIIDEHGKRVLAGGEENTTNNRMEMMAAIKGLEMVDNGSNVLVFSDSQYLVYTMTKGWKKRVNQDLWERLDVLTGKCQIQWKWIRGHDGDPLNEEADLLAGKEAGSCTCTASGGCCAATAPSSRRVPTISTPPHPAFTPQRRSS